MMPMTPWVKRLLIANIAMFFVTSASPVLYRMLLLYPPWILTRPWTLVTYMFLHGGLGHLIFKGQQAEHYAAGRLVKRGDLEIDWWAQRVDELLDYLDDLFWPDLFVFGGGISKRFEAYAHLLTTRAPVVPAVLRNQAGIVGAALAASRGVDRE